MKVILSLLFFSLPCFADVDRAHCAATIQRAGDLVQYLPLTSDGRVDFTGIMNRSPLIPMISLPDDRKNGWITLKPKHKFEEIKAHLKDGEVDQIITSEKKHVHLKKDGSQRAQFAGASNGTVTTIRTLNFASNGKKCVPTTILEGKITYSTSEAPKSQLTKVQDVGNCRQLKEFFNAHSDAQKFSAEDASKLDQIVASGPKSATESRSLGIGMNTVLRPPPTGEMKSYEKGKQYLENCYARPEVKAVIDDESAWPAGSAVALSGHLAQATE